MRQKEFNALPIFWAFSDEQFWEGAKKHGIKYKKDLKDVCRITHGGFMRKDEVHLLHEWLSMDELPEMMKDYDFAYDAFFYEMGNHEYHINWQGDWDVLSVFFDNVEYHDEWTPKQYIDSVGAEFDTRRAYLQARIDYMENANC